MSSSRIFERDLELYISHIALSLRKKEEDGAHMYPRGLHTAALITKK